MAAAQRSSEATRSSYFLKRTEEQAQITRCNSTQREVVTFDGKAKYWKEQAAFFRTWRSSSGNQLRIRRAECRQEWWDTRAAARDWNLEDEIKELEKLTAARERLQRRLRMARTGREYINHGDNSNLGERFQLLNPELNSATSVQNYMGRFMAGSSLFANEW